MSGRDGVGRELARFGAGLRFDDLPDDVRTIAKHCVLDWLGVTLAGMGDESSKIVLAEAMEQGGTPQATILGNGSKTSVGQAALVNGTASHALDYDDVQFARCVHASVCVLPAVLALAERDERSGKDLLTAFVVGVETACRVGLLVTDAHWERGHHATATLGTFGAAGGAARILGLDAEASATALGIAATQASGLKAMFGTMCKPLHAGKAASSGQYAALLAARGFTSRRDGIECTQGFADTQSPARDPGAALDGLGDAFQIRGVLFKYHASCYSTHPSIEAAARLRAEANLIADDVAHVELRVPESSLGICNIHEPRTGLEAKFSLRLTSAMAFCGWETADPARFSEDACVDHELVALRDKTVVAADPELARGTGEVVVTTRGGTVHRRFCDMREPNHDLADQGRRLQDKFLALASPVLGDSRAHEAVEMVDDLEHLDSAAPLTGCCAATTLTGR